MLASLRVVLCVAVSLSSAGCLSGRVGGGGAVEQACTTTSEGGTLCEPSAPLPPGAAAPPPLTVVTASQDALAGVALGTPAGAARAQLTSRLGEPEVEEHSCLRPDRRGSLDVPLRGQALSWPWLTAYLAPAAASGEPVLTGWETRTPPGRALARYDVRLPYGTRLDQTVDHVLGKVPDARTAVEQSGKDAGALVVRTPQASGLVWSADGQERNGLVRSAAYDPEGCR